MSVCSRESFHIYKFGINNSMAKIRPDIKLTDKINEKIKLPISYIGFKATVSFEEVGKFFKSIKNYFKRF